MLIYKYMHSTAQIAKNSQLVHPTIARDNRRKMNVCAEKLRSIRSGALIVRPPLRQACALLAPDRLHKPGRACMAALPACRGPTCQRKRRLERFPRSIES